MVSTQIVPFSNSKKVTEKKYPTLFSEMHNFMRVPIEKSAKKTFQANKHKNQWTKKNEAKSKIVV